MNITTMAIADVKPYWRNPRKNNGAVEKVALSIAEFGWRQPLVVNEDMVLLVGHTRLLAAKQLNMDTVPVHVASGLTEEQQQAYRLMDNRSHEDSGWGKSALALELAELLDADFDMALTGFDRREIDGL